MSSGIDNIRKWRAPDKSEHFDGPPSFPIARAGGFAAPTPALLLGALVLALATGFAMGVDFPNSNARFSRLAGVD